MRTRFTIIAGCTTALLFMPILSVGPDGTPAFQSSQAHAKGGGNGSGGGNGGGNGNHGGNHGGNQASNRGGHGPGGVSGAKSQRASARSSRSGQGNGKGVGNLFGDIVGAARSALGGGQERRAARTGIETSKARGRSANRTTRPMLANAPIPQPRPQRELNFNAKLAGLNSLKRNYHAYLNANDPRMTAVRSYVLASAQYEIAAEEIEALQAAAVAASEAFAPHLDGIQSYDGFDYQGLTAAELETRLETLQTVDTSALTDDELAALAEERDALESALASDEFSALSDAENELAEAEESLDTLEAATTDEALTEALLAAANRNRVEQYGAEAYVDEEMLDWAKGVLGVGDAYGKIDEVRATLEAEAPTADDSAEDEIAVVE